MEDSNFTSTDTPQLTPPQLTQESIAYLLTAAKWGKFLAILGFISIGFMFLAGLLMGLVFSIMQNQLSSMSEIATIIPPKWLSVLYILFGVISFIPVYFLNAFSNNVTRAVTNNDTNTMTTAFKRLKSLFAFIGIYTVIILALYIIAIIVVASTAMLAL